VYTVALCMTLTHLSYRPHQRLLSRGTVRSKPSSDHRLVKKDRNVWYRRPEAIGLLTFHCSEVRGSAFLSTDHALSIQRGFARSKFFSALETHKDATALSYRISFDRDLTTARLGSLNRCVGGNIIARAKSRPHAREKSVWPLSPL